jgi:hypothetical protein
VTPTPYYPQPGLYTVSPSSGGGLGVFALILAIFALFTVWIPLLIGLKVGGGRGILALILGIIGANQNVRNRGPAIAGIVVGSFVARL